MAEKSYRAEVCNICDSPAYRRIHYFSHWDLGREPVRDVEIVQCRRCGIRRRFPGIVDDYEEDYHTPYIDQKQAIHPHQLSHFADLMMVRLRNFSARDLSFLDVGCSTGRVLQLAKTLGFNATGLDYSRWAANYCSQLGFEVRHGSLLGQWPEGECFDIVHCSHTIEHVPDPVAYLQEMFRILKPAGQLMLALPNYASVPRMLLRDAWATWCLDSHLWQFTARQIRGLVKQAGFRVFSCKTLHGYTPDSLLKRKLLDWAAIYGYGDGCNIVAIKL
jgi:SAM-dependent methyltransferase